MENLVNLNIKDFLTDHAGFKDCWLAMFYDLTQENQNYIVKIITQFFTKQP